MLEPTFDPETNVVTIPRVPGVTHYVNDSPVQGSFLVEGSVNVVVKANKGSRLREGITTEWQYSSGPNPVGRYEADVEVQSSSEDDAD